VRSMNGRFLPVSYLCRPANANRSSEGIGNGTKSFEARIKDRRGYAGLTGEFLLALVQL
jgi:hypothetical protein